MRHYAAYSNGWEEPTRTGSEMDRGSVAKPVLSTAVIQLVEQGLLDLDAAVSEYIVDLDLVDEYDRPAQ